MKKISRFLVSVLVLTVFLQPVVARTETAAAPTAVRTPYIKQQMILMGLYLYGISQEMAKNHRNYDELGFLADSIVTVAGEIDETKLDKNFHDNKAVLLAAANKLKKASSTDHLKADQAALELVNSCATCHGVKSFDNPKLPKNKE